MQECLFNFKLNYVYSTSVPNVVTITQFYFPVVTNYLMFLLFTLHVLFLAFDARLETAAVSFRSNQ